MQECVLLESQSEIHILANSSELKTIVGHFLNKKSQAARCSKMQWSLRDAKEADIEGMMAVHLSCIQKMLSCHYTQDEVEHLLSLQSRRTYASLMSNGHCIVAEDGSTGDILAFGCMGKCSSDDFTAGCDHELHKLYVAPSVSRRGLGSELYLELERRVVSQGGRGIGVISTLNAVPFYQARGFEVTVEDGVVHFGERPFECKYLEKRLN